MPRKKQPGPPPASPDIVKPVFEKAFQLALAPRSSAAGGAVTNWMKKLPAGPSDEYMWKSQWENALIHRLTRDMGYAYEDANYVIDVGVKMWLKELVQGLAPKTEGKTMKKKLTEHPYPTTNHEAVPFATVKQMWLALSDGMAPDEVPETMHSRFINQIAADLGVSEDVVADMVSDWGSAGGLNAMHGRTPGVHEAKVVKLTPAQLRKLIREAGEKPAGAGAEIIDTAHAAIEHQVLELLDANLIIENAFQMIIGSVPEDELMLPGRYEDVPHWADKIADKLVKSEELKERFAGIAQMLLNNLMEPV